MSRTLALIDRQDFGVSCGAPIKDTVHIALRVFLAKEKRPEAGSR